MHTMTTRQKISKPVALIDGLDDIRAQLNVPTRMIPNSTPYIVRRPYVLISMVSKHNFLRNDHDHSLC